MPQGKLKAKTNVSTKKIIKKKQGKGPAVTKRLNAPVPKKQHNEMENKLKRLVTKNVNKSLEAEMRARAVEVPKKLSRAQEAVVKHHQKQTQKESDKSTSETLTNVK